MGETLNLDKLEWFYVSLAYFLLFIATAIDISYKIDGFVYKYVWYFGVEPIKVKYILLIAVLIIGYIFWCKQQLQKMD